MRIKFKGENMEAWKQSVLIGVILAILAGMFAAIRKEISIWIVLIIILAIVDIVFGLYRKKKEGK